MIRPIIALVGRPNVGKSTLFNRLVGRRRSIVHDVPGVTRDRLYGTATFERWQATVVDTGGFDPGAESNLIASVRDQVMTAIDEADLVVFVVDGRAGLTSLDEEIARILRRSQRPVLVAVNKIDGAGQEALGADFYRLGFPTVLDLSAEHGRGVAELLEAARGLAPAPVIDTKGEGTRVAIIGRPNVGKSSLVNAVLGEERVLVHDAPGTTRDAVDTPLTFRDRPYLLIDTAGIRRKARIADRLEQYSVVRSLGSIDRGDVIVYIIDGTEGVTSQDAQILAYAAERGKGLVLAVNKWDAVPPDKKDPRAYRQEVYRKLPFVDFAPVKFISAATGQGVGKMMASVKSVAAAYKLKVATSPLNQALRAIFAQYPPPLAQGKPVKFFYATQVGVGPPTFALFVNFAHGIGPSYERYIVRQLRQALGFEGAPLKLVIRGRREEGTNVQSRRQKLNSAKSRGRSRRRS